MTDPAADAGRMIGPYRVIGMDSARDAAEVNEAVSQLPGVAETRVSAASHTLTFSANSAVRHSDVEDAVARLGYTLEPIAEAGAAPASSVAGTPRYRRALLLVVALNAGYGVVEMIGGFISESQALKADALDFLGDGLVTLLAVLAIGWSLAWRAKAALIQGAFLALLAIGVLVSTAYRAGAQQQPDAELMGLLGLIGVVVNLAAAAALLPYRSGDANVKAVWLFSRNDAIGNLAVVGAAGLVALTGSSWPDLVVAIAIAALFLQSSRVILRDASAELRGLRLAERKMGCRMPDAG